MAFNVYSDPRSNGLSKAGIEELESYCNWLMDNQIKDSEENFVHFATHRAELSSSRHLFNVWEAIVEQDNVSLDSRLQVMRFFLNPTAESFRRQDVSGWFDFIPLAHDMGKKIHPTVIYRPEFKKVGFKDERKGLSATSLPMNIIGVSVILKDVGEKKIEVIKDLRKIKGISFEEAVALIETLPKTIFESISSADASRIKQKLESVGARVDVV